MDDSASVPRASWFPGEIPGLDITMPDLELTPWRIVAVYLAFGFVGLYVSDVIFRELFAEPLRSQVQAVKGALEVLVTAGYIFAITTASRRQLERTNRRLQRRNDELTVLHRVLRHNLRNDLNVIEGQATYVEEELEKRELTDNCERITNKTGSILEYVERAGQIRRLGEADMSGQFDLARVVPAIVERHEAITDAVTVTVDVPDSAPVEANHMLSAAIEELIENAIVHADRDDPSVSVRVSRDDAPPGRTAVEVSDDGPGLPEHVQTIIESGERDQLAHLDGLGLWFVRWTVTDADGTLSFDVEETGTTVRLTIPSGAQ